MDIFPKIILFLSAVNH